MSSDEAIPYDAFFSCYSVSKPLTTISALQCVERGLIGLDDDLSGHLPELAQQPIISLAADDALSYELAKNSITLRHLLTHTSGLAYDGPQPLIARWRKETQGLPPMWKCGDLLLAYSTPRLFEAGESWQYGSGLEWAGLLVSRLNGGEPLGQYMEENIFRPLGATDSTFHPNGRPDLQKRRLEMVGRNSEGIFEPAPEHWIYPEDPKDDCGGLGLFSTVPDLIQVIGDLASTSPVLLKLDTIETMFTPHFEYHEGVNKGMVGMQVSSSCVELDSVPFTPMLTGECLVYVSKFHWGGCFERGRPYECRFWSGRRGNTQRYSESTQEHSDMGRDAASGLVREPRSWRCRAVCKPIRSPWRCKEQFHDRVLPAGDREAGKAEGII